MLYEGEDKTVWQLPRVLVRRVVVALRIQLSEVMDEMRTGYGEKTKERQHRAEGMEMEIHPSVPTSIW